MPAHGVLPDEPAFADRRRMPVSAEFHADGEVGSTGIAYEDSSRFQTRRKKVAPGRRIETPSWAVNRSEMRQLITRFWELRAGIKEPAKASLKKRLQHAEWIIQHEKVPRQRAILEKLCFERMATDDPKRRRELAIEIRSIDTFIRTAEQGPALIAGVLYFYYGVGYPSHEVASALGVKCVAVRQLLNRLHRTWKRMQDGTDTRWGAIGRPKKA